MTPSNKCPRYDIKQSDFIALGNVEYSFIAITPWSTLAQSGSIWCVLSMDQIELFYI